MLGGEGRRGEEKEGDGRGGEEGRGGRGGVGREGEEGRGVRGRNKRSDAWTLQFMHNHTPHSGSANNSLVSVIPDFTTNTAPVVRTQYTCVLDQCMEPLAQQMHSTVRNHVIPVPCSCGVITKQPILLKVAKEKREMRNRK